mmetsp:Transcript_2686/g.12131  ORF Transcript_2686/g.12131 Transcript_2686/m.12131 type:complete len:225 (+) Transcript_2686:300-974(+)
MPAIFTPDPKSTTPGASADRASDTTRPSAFSPLGLYALPSPEAYPSNPVSHVYSSPSSVSTAIWTYPKVTATAFASIPATKRGFAADVGSRSKDSRVMLPPRDPHRLRPHVTTFPSARTAAEAYRPAATAAAAEPKADKSTKFATPLLQAAPPTHSSPAVYSTLPSPPPTASHAQLPPLSHTHPSPSVTPYVPCRPSCPRSLSPNVTILPEDVNAQLWYRPAAH